MSSSYSRSSPRPCCGSAKFIIVLAVKKTTLLCYDDRLAFALTFFSFVVDETAAVAAAAVAAEPFAVDPACFCLRSSRSSLRIAARSSYVVACSSWRTRKRE